MATIKGRVTIEGMDGVTVTYAALVANGKLDPISAEATDEADIEPLKNTAGVRQGYRIKDPHIALTIDCYATVSTGTSRADAKKALVQPARCSKVTLAGFEAANLNGDYVYEKGAKWSLGDQWAKMTLPLIKPEDTTPDTICAAVTA